MFRVLRRTVSTRLCSKCKQFLMHSLAQSSGLCSENLKFTDFACLITSPDKSTYLRIIFPISLPNHVVDMVLKRTVSMRVIFSIGNTCLTDD